MRDITCYFSIDSLYLKYMGYKFKVCIVTACAVVYKQRIFRIGYLGMFLMILHIEFHSSAIRSKGKIIL